MEIPSAAVGECTKSAIVHVEREFGYLIYFKKSTNTLKHKIQQLTATRSHVQAMTDASLRNGELINAPVQEWMTRVDCLIVEAIDLSNEASIINSWFSGWCCGRFSIGRKAQKIIEAIQRIYEEGSGFGANNVSYRKPTQSLKLVGTEDFKAFASRDFIVTNICKALLDDAINLIGVYGMAGVGKTVLIKAIAKQVKEEQLFQEVVVVTVSRNLSLIKLQGDIAEGLDFDLIGDNLSRRAGRLSEILDQDTKTTLVILDDVWKRIELSDIGIPYKNRGKCCKVVFTTRFQAVCDTMEANSKIEVSILPEEDSWTLFQQKSGDVADSALARDMLKECKGLPLAIVTLGLALRNKDAIVWADTLVQLRKSILKGMSLVVSSIKLSYDFLENESVKICFLFCSLFPEDHKIKMNVLLRYMMAEKLLEDVDTYDEARGRLHGMVDKLVSSSLLLRVSSGFLSRDEEGDIMMHDVVRDAAISIAAEEEWHVVKAGRNLSYWPDMDLGNCKRLSIMYNSIQHLPTIPIKAPHLLALFLNDNYITEIPSRFFGGMKSLMTLDLSLTRIKSLPPSLSFLQNLRTLLVNRTYLQDLSNLSPIEMLERLEVLSLRNCRFTEEFPEGIWNLSNLRILDLTGVGIKRFTPELFSRLLPLEEFHVLERIDHQPDESREIDFFREVGLLSRLTSLELQVYNPELCYIDIPGPWQNLTRFQIVVNTGFEDVFRKYKKNKKTSRSLWLHNIRGKQVANWVLLLLGRANHLELQMCDDLLSLDELGSAAGKGMNENMKSLHLDECDNMECLVSSYTGLFHSNENAFCNLEELKIERMDAFVEIWKGTPPPRLLYKLKKLSFRNCGGLVTAIPHTMLNLEYLEVADCNNLLYVLMEEEGTSNMSRISKPLLLPIFPTLKYVLLWCPKIRYVFTMRVARNLLLLNELDIQHCSKMEVIFKYEDGEDIQCHQQFKDTAILPRLKVLYVWDAPKLRSFTNQNLVTELPSLEEMWLTKCGILERLPFGTTSVPNLKTLKMDQEISNKLEWEDESVKVRLQAIRTEPVNFFRYNHRR